MESKTELHEFHRNLKASSTVQSLAQAEGSVIGAFPPARYPGWVNSVWKMEVWMYSKARHEKPSPEPQNGYSDTVEATVASPRSTGVRIADLDDMLHIANSAIQLGSEDRPDQVANLNDRAKRFYDRYISTNALDDLEEAIRAIKQSLEGIPEGHPYRGGQLSNLSIILSARYSRTGGMVDLEEAIRIARQAVETTPEDHPDRARRSNNLGNRLGARYSRTGAMADLEEAIRVARQAVEVTPNNHPDLAV
ncbi:hypothetical protein CcaCcLH18_07876 [Colletotrichum camelliae]|nr:hypothetical protein CcaCcLH18_07876 [Colletotrichum camelliae]